jgi:hypothetical protein
MSNGVLARIALDPAILKDPKELGEIIVELATAIESCKDDLQKIRERSIWRRLFANNTRDVADVLIKQNDTISLFLHIVQALTILNVNNSAVLAGIQEQLCRFQDKRGTFTSKYLQMASDYISAALAAARRVADQLDRHSAQLDGLHSDLQSHKTDEEDQTRIMVELLERYRSEALVSAREMKDQFSVYNTKLEQVARDVEAERTRSENHSRDISAVRDQQRRLLDQDSVQGERISGVEKNLAAQETLQARVDRAIESIENELDAHRRAATAARSRVNAALTVAVCSVGMSVVSVALAVLALLMRAH